VFFIEGTFNVYKITIISKSIIYVKVEFNYSTITSTIQFNFSTILEGEGETLWREGQTPKGTAEDEIKILWWGGAAHSTGATEGEGKTL